MRSSGTLALGLVALTLVAGCSLRSMEDRYDKITGHDKKKNEDRVDLNSAGRKRLAKLPGLTGEDADRIVANRPYTQRRDLVRKGVLSEAKFDRIRDEVYVDHEKD
jgi:DNA uptake protein ComE-like DNA-binding protein